MFPVGDSQDCLRRTCRPDLNSSIAVIVVTLLVVFDRLQDQGQNKQTKKGGDDDEIYHGASSTGFFGLALYRYPQCVSGAIGT